MASRRLFLQQILALGAAAGLAPAAAAIESRRAAAAELTSSGSPRLWTPRPLVLPGRDPAPAPGQGLSLSQIPPVHFVDIAARCGLRAADVYGGMRHKDFIISTTGNGVCAFDYDNDGWLDIFLPNGWKRGLQSGAPDAPTQHLFKNNRDGTFTDVTREAGLDRSGWGQGACVGDYDNDGHLDLLVTCWGQNALYHNNGNGTFTEVTAQAGLLTPEREWSTGACFVDYDRDGHLDIFLARYVDFSYNSVPRPGEGRYCQWKGIEVMCGPRGLKGGVNALYHNNGDGTFTDVSEKSGIIHPSGYYGFTPLTGDYNGDGWPDIYVSCDSTPSIFYRNNKNGTFTDIGAISGLAYNGDGAEQAGMGVSAGDYLRRGRLDIIKTNFSDDTPTLYKNEGKFNFDDVTYAAGLGRITKYLGWGVMFMDFANSGWLDIFICNGHVYPEVDEHHLGTTFMEPKVLYYNLRDGRFANITARAGRDVRRHHSSRGLAIGDFFNEGKLSALVNNMGQMPSFFYNTAPVGNFISLQLIGQKSNRSAIGCGVTLECEGQITYDEVRSGGSFISQNDLRLHFGLGAAKEADKITLRWPSGEVEVLKHVAANRFYTIREGEGIEKKLTRSSARIIKI